jgi:hypothetical protein
MNVANSTRGFLGPSALKKLLRCLQREMRWQEIVENYILRSCITLLFPKYN